MYVYDECVLSWTLPAQYIPPVGTVTPIATMVDIKNYVNSVSDEIMAFAKGTKLSLVPDISNKSIEYVTPVYKNYPTLFADASTDVNNALVTYDNAVAAYITALANYNTALSAYTTAGIPVTSVNAVSHIQPLANAVQAMAAENAAFALAFPAVKSAIAALVAVVTVLAQERKIVAPPS